MKINDEKLCDDLLFSNRYLYENSMVNNDNKQHKRNSGDKSGFIGKDNYDLTFNMPEQML